MPARALDARAGSATEGRARPTLREHDAALAAHTEQVNRATVRHEAAVAECERLAAGLAQAAAAVDGRRGCGARRADDRARRTRWRRRGPILDASAREGMLAALEAARDGEMRARLDVETLRERIRAGRGAGSASSSGSASASARRPRRRRGAPWSGARSATSPRGSRRSCRAVLDSVERSVAQARVELAARRAGRAEH